MKKETQQLERRGLPGGPNEMFTYNTGVFSTEGFRMDSPDVNNYQNIIPSGSISMKEKDGSPLRKGPIHGVDNLGNAQVMYPGYNYQFPGTEVTETLMAKMGGALLDKTIKCGNCGWEWKAADGGSDVMDCHKCGGKGLVKAQVGTEVKYGTPEYTEAYNKGEVITDEGVRSPILLDEVVVQGKKRKKGFWEQSRDKYLKDHQDDGLFEAIGSVVTYPLSVPQHALTYATTGKVQDPSEAWGYNTNERWLDSPGAFGRNLADASLNIGADPSNLVGAGIFTKGTKVINALNKGKALSKGIVSYGDDLIQASKIAGKPKLPTYNNTYRWQADVVPESLINSGKSLTAEQQALTGSWYTHDVNQLPFYMRTRPGSGNVNVSRLSDTKIADLERNMSDAARGMSGKTESVAASNTSLPGELILPKSLKDKVKQFKFDVNPSEYPLSSKQQELLKEEWFIGSPLHRSMLQENTSNIINPILEAQYPPIMGIPRKYFPYAEGGEPPIAQKGTETIPGGKDIKVRYSDGTIKTLNTGSPEYVQRYNTGQIQTEKGIANDTWWGGVLDDVVVQQQSTPLSKLRSEYAKKNTRENFINQKKDEYIKGLGKSNWYGIDRNNFPENVLKEINQNYDYNKNTYALEQLAKKGKYDLNERGAWVDNLTAQEKKALINSKYSSQLNPNEFSNALSGVQQLVNTALPGKPLGFDIPGLTPNENKEDAEAMLSGLKVFSPLNIPGNYIANAMKNNTMSSYGNFRETPTFGTQRMGNVSEMESMGLNPISYEGLASLPHLLESGYNITKQGYNSLKNIPTSISDEARIGLRTNGLTFNGTPRKHPINNYQRTATEDVDRLFEEFPELAKTGSKEEYIKYLETIHPETTQPGIFYRGSNQSHNPSEWIPNPSGGNNLGEGFYFTPDPFKTQNYGKEMKALLDIKDPTYTSLRLNNNGLMVPKGMKAKDIVGEGSAAISIQNPNRELFTEMGSRAEGYMRRYKGALDEQGFPAPIRPYANDPNFIDYSKIDELVVPNNSQIHVLGSDADKELFKNYINNNKKGIAPSDPFKSLNGNTLNDKEKIVHTLDNSEFILEDKIKETNDNLLNLFNTVEGKRRLNLLGVDASKLNKPNFRFSSTESGYFPKNNSLDIDIKEAIKLGIDPKSIYEHEIGHWLQKQYGDQSSTLMRQNFYDTPIDKKLIESYPKNYADDLLKENLNIDWNKVSKETSGSYMLKNKEEGLPFLREMRQNMINKNYINNPYDDISEETINKFIKENPDDRLSSFTEPNSKQSKVIYELFKNLPTVVPGAVGLGTLGLMQEEDGGEPSTQTIPAPSPLIEYVVKKGDTLGKIAAANNTSIRSIMKNNENISDPNLISINQKINIVNKSADAPKEEVYKDWNIIRDKKDKTNKLSDEQKIVSFHNDKPEESYLIVDKKNAVMKLYTGGNLTKSFEVGVGQNPGDAQTVTKVINGKTDWSGGNKSTGAGIYTISNINPASEEYYNEPAFNLKNENGIEVATTIHGTPKPRRIKFNNGTVVDNRMSNGCINGKCEDLKELYGQLDVNTKVYILPEDVGNNFQIIDGKPALRVSSQNRQKYNSYVDQTGTTQKGQGANQTTNTLVYKPIKAYINEVKFKDDVFQWNDFNDEKEYTNTTKPFIVGLTTNKKEVMKAAKISSDVYNELAKMSFGIYGTESNFGDTHSAVGNLARASNKFLDPKSSSSPDYESKASTYGADEETRSVGLTQLRWNYLNKDEKAALKEVGITSNKDFLDPKKAAIGTVTVLGVRYNQQLNDKQKQDVWKYLPSKWNNRANYGSRVKSNSSYLSFKQLDKKQEGGEFFMAQLGMEKKPYLSYKDFLASIQKDKVVDYKERPQPVVIESTKTVMPETPKKLTKQQAKIVQKDLYENPFKPEGITSGDKTVDFLYNNEWLMNTPIVGDYIKDRAKEIATNSGGSQTVKNINQKAGTTDYSQSGELGYTGNFGFNQTASLVDQYFSKEPLLPISKYKPSSDYLEFLPTYSVKGYFDKDPKQIAQLNDVLNFNTQDSKYKEFLKNKKPIYLDENTGLPDIMGIDLGGHKTGIGWDDKMNLPYMSISDAWDFEPSDYSKKWSSKGGTKKEKDKAFIQSYLMHKTGNPFKIYDRFYFNPETKQYIPDEQLKTYQKGGESKPGPLMKAYNRLPSEKKMGGAVVNKKEFGGQLLSNKEIDKKNITMYKNYVKGIIGNETEAVKNYDKLNRIYYNKAKELGMTAANYVMTHVVGNS